MQRVSSDNLEFDDDFYRAYLNGVPFTGVAEERLPDGTLISEETFVDGMRHGRGRDWLATGQLIEEDFWRCHGRHGPQRQWHPDGSRKRYEYFKYGVLIRSLGWDERDQIVRDMRLNEQHSFYAHVCGKLAEDPSESNDIWAGVDDNMELPETRGSTQADF